ncbi:hypothetical protein ACM26_03760 [Helicobacter pylori]|nr:hypothetical protein ACM26_03760 [Helicobacter pylori]
MYLKRLFGLDDLIIKKLIAFKSLYYNFFLTPFYCNFILPKTFACFNFLSPYSNIIIPPF